MDLDPTEYYRIVSPQKAREITSLSPREQDRREQAGTFPKSIRLGHGHNGRKGRLLGELIDWCKARVAERDQAGEAA